MARRSCLYRRAQALLPQAVATTGLHRMGVSPGQCEGMLLEGLQRAPSSGAVVLALSAHSADAMACQGLAYFRHAIVARAALAGPAPACYVPWQRSPLPAEWGAVESGSGPWRGAGHAGSGDGALCRRLHQAWAEGGYYTHRVDGRAWLVVLPRERLVVYSWRD